MFLDTMLQLLLFRDSRRRSMLATERNVFSGAFGVIMFACDASETGRVIDYCGDRYVVSGSANKLLKLWDATTGKASFDQLRFSIHRLVSYSDTSVLFFQYIVYSHDDWTCWIHQSHSIRRSSWVGCFRGI
jgi:hypothetical protein